MRSGASVMMSCKASGYTFSNYTMHWVKQSHGKGHERIGYIDNYYCSTDYSEKFKIKATLTVNKSCRTAYVKLSRLTSEDSAVYYCVRHSGKITS